MKNKTLLLATSNPGKFSEMKSFLERLPLQLLSLKDVNISDVYEETGLTFEENAKDKAAFYAQKSRLDTLAEDSGIIVDALHNELGVKTRRWGKGEQASDQEWIEYFLKVMQNVPEEKRTASFICCVGLYWQNEVLIFKAETKGIITKSLEAPIKPGLPLSSCFKPFGSEKVYAALSTEEKNRLSHRGKAISAVEEYFRKIL